jgi:hypothetical protein
MENYLEIFTESYQRVVASSQGDKDFFAAFYDAFINDSAVAREKFRGVDMLKQKEHLRKSLDHMVYFSIDRQASDEMRRIARAHGRSGKDISPELYESWLDSLVNTVREYDPRFDDEVEIAWRVVLAPGISYMQLQYPRS